MDRVRVGLIGSQFVSDIHAHSLKQVPEAEIVAVASKTRDHAESLARKHNILRVFTDYREMLEMKDLDVVIIGAPNDLHCQMTVDSARAKKHVICEKPLCITLDEADTMINVCKEEGVKLMYAEEICFAPKYARAKQLVDEGALGRVYLVKQSEKHDGPHSDWFWDVERSGGGVLLDMGCHGIEFARWILGKPRIKSVMASAGTYVHKNRTRGEDNSIVILEFETGAAALIEDSWAKPGGMDDVAEIYGADGVIYADLLHGNSLRTFSRVGYGYAVEKAPDTKGWSFTIYEEAWNYGFPQEMQHFCQCIINDTEPMETGEDGRAVLEAIFAAYESLGTGKKIELPFTPPKGKKPIDLWLNR